MFSWFASSTSAFFAFENVELEKLCGEQYHCTNTQCHSQQPECHFLHAGQIRDINSHGQSLAKLKAEFNSADSLEASSFMHFQTASNEKN
jgi:hypothetical protein